MTSLRTLLRFITPLALLTQLPPPAIWGAEPTAQEILTEAGLQLVGRHWTCAEESDLRRQLELMPKFERNLASAQQQFRQLVGQYQETRTKFTTLKSLLADNRARLSQTNVLAALQKQQLESEANRYSEQMSQAEKAIQTRLNALDETSEMTLASVEHVNARNALAVCLLTVTRQVEETRQRYMQLAADRRIATAIGQAAAGQLLGPIENYEVVARRRVARLEPLVFGDGVPIYRRSGMFRASAIAAEQTLVTFSYMGVQGPTLIPASLAQSCGAMVLKDAPASQIAEGERQINTRAARVPSLRWGRHVLRNVPVEILPPEAEDLGARISQQAFGDLPVSLDEKNLWLQIQSAGVPVK